MRNLVPLFLIYHCSPAKCPQTIYLQVLALPPTPTTRDTHKTITTDHLTITPHLLSFLLSFALSPSSHGPVQFGTQTVTTYETHQRTGQSTCAYREHDLNLDTHYTQKMASRRQEMPRTMSIMENQVNTTVDGWFDQFNRCPETSVKPTFDDGKRT